MHVHIAWQIYHHQQKVKVSLAFLALGGGLPAEEVFAPILLAGRIRCLLEKLSGNLTIN